MKTWYKVVVGGVFVLTFLVLLVVVVLIGTMPDLQVLASHQDGCTCMTSGDDEDASLVCGYTHNKFTQHVLETVDQEYNRLIRREEEKQSKMGDSLLDVVPVRQWMTDQTLADYGGFIRNGMQVQSGRIVIRTPGLYNIYSSLSLFASSEMYQNFTDTDEHEKPIKHAIFKYNILHGAEVELVYSAQPQLNFKNRLYNVYSSFVSSVENLKAGDELILKFSKPSYLKYPWKSYLGAFLI